MEWVLLGLVGGGLVLLLTMTLMRISGEEDRAARHAQRRIDPYSDVTITRHHQ